MNRTRNVDVSTLSLSIMDEWLCTVIKILLDSEEMVEGVEQNMFCDIQYSMVNFVAEQLHHLIYSMSKKFFQC